ncbi:MAG: hypothetical protein Q8R28_11255 [Dehalococcoidia bacterium]|nr:hypothetical protein [Dehalococcoidia bacterium]
MTLRKRTIVQTDQAAWAADSPGIRTALERVGLITELQLQVEVTPSATLTGANQPDGLFRLINNLAIEGGGGGYVTLPGDDGCQGGTLLHYLGQRDGFGPGHRNGAIAAPDGVATPMVWTIHPGSRPKRYGGYFDPYDLSAFIPASMESQLNAIWTTSGNDVMDDTVTITSAIMRFVISRVTGSEAEIAQEMQAQGVTLPPIAGITGMVPQWSQIVHANAAATTNIEAETVDITGGAFLKRVAMLLQDATATRTLRATDEVTEVAHLVGSANEKLFHYTVEVELARLGLGTNLTANSGASESAATEKFGADFNGHAPGGVFIHDYRPQTMSPWTRDYGLNLIGVKSGDHKYGFIIDIRAAGDDTLILMERLAPYFGSLG